MKKPLSVPKAILFFSLLLNLIAVAFAGKRIYWSYFRKVYPVQHDRTQAYKNPFWCYRNDLIKQMPKDSNDIILVGTSLTDFFPLQLLQNPHVKNRGICGDLTEGVISRLAPIAEGDPNKIFVEIGINDIAYKVPNDTILLNFESIIDTLKKNSPHTSIYIQSLFPVADKENTALPGYCNATNNKNIKILNRQLAEIAGKKQVVFIDLYSHFVKDDHLNPEYSIDGIHLSYSGYILWARLLMPYVNSGKQS